MTSTVNLAASQSWLNQATDGVSSFGKSAVELIKDFDYEKLFLGSLFSLCTFIYADLAYIFFATGGWYILGGFLFAGVAVGFAAFGCSLVFNGEGWRRHGRKLLDW